MRSKMVDICVIALVCANVLGIVYIAEQQNYLTASMKKDIEYIKEEMDEIYGMKAREEAKAYVLMDTMIRVFHNAKPHKTPQPACPECDSLIRKGLELPKRKPGEKTVWQQYLEKKNGSPNAKPGSHKHGKSNG